MSLPPGVSWVRTTINNIPKNAYVGGWEDRGKRHVYIGHGEHMGSVVCGKTIQFWGGTFVPFFGSEVKLPSFEVLVADNPNVLKWVPASGATVPQGAIQGGKQGPDTLYIARGKNPIHEPTPGKLHPPHGFFLSWGGKEHRTHDYEVLVANPTGQVPQPQPQLPQAPQNAVMRPQQVLPKGASWVKTTIKNIPKNAFVGGWEDGGKRKVYIGRAAHPDSLICGKVIQFWGGMFFPLLGKEVKNDNFEILVADNPNVFKWVKSSGALMKTTNIPENAVHGGYQGSETLYVARGINPAKEPTPGKLHPPWGFFLSWGGKEHHKPDFEVLVCDSATETSTAAQQPSKAKKPAVGPDTISIASSAPSGPEPVYWVATKDANIPKNAVFSNKGGNGDFYIGRAKHKGSWIPGKVAPHRKKMYYPLDGKEHSTSIYEILVTDTPSVIQWIAASGAGVPKDAFVGGYFGKQPLYVARAKGPDGFLHPGRLQLSQGFFLSLNGKEHKVNNYEVFVISGYLDSDMSNSMSNLSVDVPSETSEELAGDAPCEDLTVDVPCV